MKHTFSLDGYPYIMLNNLLKVLHLVGTGGEANIRITEGEVTVNGLVELQKRKKIKAGDNIEFSGQTIEVLD
jgi:ribosome-associated protein